MNLKKKNKQYNSKKKKATKLIKAKPNASFFFEKKK